MIDSLSNVEETSLSQEELFSLFDLSSPHAKKQSQTGGDGKPPVATTRDQMLALSPQKFEEFVEALYKKMGYGTRRTAMTRDGGIDIIATSAAAGEGASKLAIQCKRYDDGNAVGEPAGRDLLGVISKDSSFTKGVLVTTGRFSEDCRRFAAGVGRIELIDGPRLAQLAEQFEVVPQ